MNTSRNTHTSHGSDTICAVATAPGRGGVGIVRISGPQSYQIAKSIVKRDLKPRYAHYGPFYSTDPSKNLTEIDQGISLYFPNPDSFTGEDVVELQGHGGPIVMDLLLTEILQHGARLARPGEFSERAYLNDKMDLAQAEAIADLINATTTQAAKQAVNSLKGEFSNKINDLVDALIHIRMYVESAIDFPEEEIDFLSDGHVANQVNGIIQRTNTILKLAEQGAIVREGMTVVIAGRPNAGKSSLLNALAERDIAIVTDIEGTTRDVLREQIQIDGMPLHIIDTAGLRDSDDHVEQIGVQRAWKEIEAADRILLMIDSTCPAQLNIEQHWPEFLDNPSLALKTTVIYNKTDQSNYTIKASDKNYTELPLSAKTGEGLSHLKDHLKKIIGLDSNIEGAFSARRRHIDALKHALTALENGRYQLESASAGELLAEDLRLAQEHLSEITGKFSSDDLLGEIFSSFCIGK